MYIIGLVKARLLGASQARGQVLTFLDSHVECVKGWIQPLLARIVQDRTRLVSPVIDVIVDENFEYQTASSELWGSFDWTIQFKWKTMPHRELYRRRSNPDTAPIR